MKLITSKGQLALPSDFTFSLEKESPFFGESGTTSIPVTLPVSQDSFQKLGRPERLGAPSSFLRKIPAKLEAGMLHKDGVLVIDTVCSSDGIVASIALDESELYTTWKDCKLSEIFDGVVRTDLSGVDEWVDYLLRCATGELDDWFTIAPVAVNREEKNGVVSFQFLNDVDDSSSEEVWPLIKNARNIIENGEPQAVPRGYGIAPFFYLGKFLEQLFILLGYSLRENPFLSDPTLSKIIMLHSAADSICSGYINVSDIVPTCTLSEFLEFLNARFHAGVFVYPEQKITDIVLFEDMLKSKPCMDLSSLLDGAISITYPDPQQISLESNNEFDDSEPAEETLHQFIKKYPICNSVSETSFSKEGMSGCVFRKALGRFYLFSFDSNIHETVGEHLGTNNFNYCLNTKKVVSTKAVDASYGMISYTRITGRPIVAPYIGEKRHPSGCYQLPETTSEQQIILAFAPGKAASSGAITAGYYLCTNQKYNNIGEQWGEWGLNYADMYEFFWKGYNYLLQNSSPSVKGKFDISLEKILSLRIDKPMLILGQQAMMSGISYNIGNAPECGQSKFIIIPNLDSPIVDDIPVIQEQRYKWQYNCNIDDVLAEWDDPMYTVVSWEYEEEHRDISDELPAPTELGQKTYQNEVGIIILIKVTTQTEIKEERIEAILKEWYQSVVI